MDKVLEKFFVCSPEKYYSKEAYTTYFDFLSESLVKNKAELLQFLTSKEEAINMSYKLLASINSKPIHEYQVKDTDAVFIDEYINYGYLQLLEGVLLVYVQLVTYIELINEGKKTDNLDLFTCIEKLGKGKFSYLKSVYDNTVRNGIGHGKIVYGESKAEYIDKKDNKVTFYYYQFIRKFDLLLDIINGFVLAYITFWSEEVNKLSIELPRQLIFEEVRLNSTLPHWQVTNVINQQILDKRQLSIVIRSSCSLQTELRDHAVKTAVHAAHLIGDKFDIIELHITHNEFPGYVKFDVKLLNELDHTSAGSEIYSSTVVDSLELFFSGFTNVMPASMDSNYFKNSSNPVLARDCQEKVGLFVYKDISQNVNSYNDFMRVKDARYVYNGIDKEKSEIVSSIKNSLSDLLRHARKKSDELTRANGHISLPIKYICIAIYEKDARARTLRSNGIKPNLICTIQYNSTIKMGNIKLMDSQTENFQGVFFNWNHYWRNAEAYEKMFPE